MEDVVDATAAPESSGQQRQPNDGARADEGEGLRDQGECRLCGAALCHVAVDLGMTPLANSYLDLGQLAQPEVYYPLRAYVCERCFLVQLAVYAHPEQIFGEYAYFSSYSESWLRHARSFAEAATARFALGAGSRVIELASNDGYLLQYFARAGIPTLGIEPAANVAEAARERGLPTLTRFFGRELARELVGQNLRADLLVGNNVLAHVPDLNDFVAGMALLLREGGAITMEFPHLLRLVEGNQFDTIYHEHFSYFSLLAAERLFARHGLTIFDVDQLPTHGGSLRIYARHTQDTSRPIDGRVAILRAMELASGLTDLATYRAFGARVWETKWALLTFLIAARRAGASVAAYGAPAKGNTLLNFCGIRGDLVAYTVDRSPHKQGRFLPGTHLPILDPARIAETRPDYLLILAWNLREEIMAQMASIRTWGGRFVVPIPEVRVFL